ncbi:MAG: hypothetical protein BWY42_01500 [Candidatus Omnitrophica bacterium ADurb.Bin277]|nr:MAG: hypothetical protein BWY42_01500 [Candidatus Omnitrophica bacterium ADurb.Bin277]
MIGVIARRPGFDLFTVFTKNIAEPLQEIPEFQFRILNDLLVRRYLMDHRHRAGFQNLPLPVTVHGFLQAFQDLFNSLGILILHRHRPNTVVIISGKFVQSDLPADALAQRDKRRFGLLDIRGNLHRKRPTFRGIIPKALKLR